MRRVVLACVVVLALPGTAAAATSARSGSATASAGGGTAELSNGRITRAWSTSDGVVTTTLRRGKKGRNWSSGHSPDFTLTLDSVPTSSVSGWTLTGVRARQEPTDPARPDRMRGVQLVFDYELDPAGLITLERTYTLRSGASAIGVSSVLHNGSPAPCASGRTRWTS